MLDGASPHPPLMLLEIKALYSFDAAFGLTPDVGYPSLIGADIAKAARLASDETEVFALAVVTHPGALPAGMAPGVIKYQSSIARGLRSFATESDIREMAMKHLLREIGKLGPLSTGSIDAGSAFGVDVVLDWMLVGPVPRPVIEARANQAGGVDGIV